MDFGISSLANISITAAIPIGVLFLRLVLDTIGIHSVEKKIMTNFKKFTIYFSQIIFIAGITEVFFLLFNVPNAVEIQQVNPVLANFLAFFIITSAFFLLITGTFKLLNIQIVFYILDEEKKEKWYIKRAISNNKILLSKGLNCFKFIDLESINNRKIYRTYNEKRILPLQNFINNYSNKITAIFLLTVWASSIIGLIIINKYNSFEVIINLVLLIESFFAMYVVACRNNMQVMNEIDNEISIPLIESN